LPPPQVAAKVAQIGAGVAGRLLGELLPGPSPALAQLAAACDTLHGAIAKSSPEALLLAGARMVGVGAGCGGCTALHRTALRRALPRRLCADVRASQGQRGALALVLAKVLGAEYTGGGGGWGVDQQGEAGAG
jgi:hypothetical protein